MAFCIWLLSVSIIMFSRFIHVVACISTSFLFVAKYNSIVWIYDLLFIYSSFNGHFGLFPLLAIMNNASMNICKFFVWTCNFNSLGYWSYDNSMLNFFFNFIIIYFIYLFLAALGLCCCARAFSSCGEWGLLFVVVRGLLFAVASLVAEHGLQAPGFRSCGAWALERRLSSCGTRA